MHSPCLNAYQTQGRLLRFLVPFGQPPQMGSELKWRAPKKNVLSRMDTGI